MFQIITLFLVYELWNHCINKKLAMCYRGGNLEYPSYTNTSVSTHNDTKSIEIFHGKLINNTRIEIIILYCDTSRFLKFIFIFII